jgi:pseudoazurin
MATGLGFSAAASGAEQVVRLVTDSPQGRFRFEPPLVFAAPGDEVRFVPDSGLHGVKSIAGMLPAGVASWRGRMGQEVTIRVDRPGVYGVKCGAHYSIGMVGLIVVGREPPNWSAARTVRHPPVPADFLARLFQAVACQLGSAPATSCAEPATTGR